MPQHGRIVGIDVSKLKAEACIRSLQQRLSEPSTPQGEAALIAWLRANAVALAVMEASGGYERSWAEALRKAGIAVRVVDPKRVRYFAKSAGRLAKNDPIDAEMIAWFGETFTPEAEPTHDPERAALDQLVTARRRLIGLATQVAQLAEHRQPRLVAQAQQAIGKIIKSQLAKLEIAIDAKIAANAAFRARAAIIRSVPGLGPHFTAGAIAWLPELGRISSKAAAALVGVAPYDDDSGEHHGERRINGGRREIRDLLYMATLDGDLGRSEPPQPRRQGLLSTAARQGEEGQGRPGGLHAQADRHPQHHAGAGPELEPARCRRRPRMSERTPARSAPAVDRMTANQPGERTGSRPQPPKAGAPSARLCVGHVRQFWG
jgi:transposase